MCVCAYALLRAASARGTGKPQTLVPGPRIDRRRPAEGSESAEHPMTTSTNITNSQPKKTKATGVAKKPIDSCILKTT